MFVRCSILVASKIQVYPTVGDSNSKVRGCGLSINQFFRGPPPIPVSYFMSALRKFLEGVRVEKEVREELKNLMNSIAFSLTIFTKFEDILDQLSLSSEYFNLIEE